MSERTVLGMGATAVELPEDMRFDNGDISLDEAVAAVKFARERGEAFTAPNVDLLVRAVMNAEWDD